MLAQFLSVFIIALPWFRIGHTCSFQACQGIAMNVPCVYSTFYIILFWLSIGRTYMLLTGMSRQSHQCTICVQLQLCLFTQYILSSYRYSLSFSAHSFLSCLGFAACGNSYTLYNNRHYLPNVIYTYMILWFYSSCSPHFGGH
jgi:hypothetical protein